MKSEIQDAIDMLESMDHSDNSNRFHIVINALREHAKPHLRIDIEPIERAKITADMLPNETVFEGRYAGIDSFCRLRVGKVDAFDWSGCPAKDITVTRIIEQPEGTEPVELQEVPETLADVDQYVLCTDDVGHVIWKDSDGYVIWAKDNEIFHWESSPCENKVTRIIGKVTGTSLHCDRGTH